MKILIVSSYESTGGAAKSALRLHEALLAEEINSNMLVQQKNSDRPKIFPNQGLIQKAHSRIRPALDLTPTRFYKNKDLSLFSPSILPFSSTVKKINQINPDLVHLHWICGGMIKIEDIAKKGNNVTQRVFGDWYQEMILTDKEIATWHNKLFEDFANHAIDTMNNTLAKDSKILNQLLQMSEAKSYLYVTPEKAYDVPGTESGIKVKLQQVEGITKPEVDGVSQKFYVRVQNAEKEGIDETQFARLELYIRYANGLFASNPTLRIQSLENPEHLSWTPI